MDSSSESESDWNQEEEEDQRLFVVGCYAVHIGDQFNNFRNSTGEPYIAGVYKSREGAEAARKKEMETHIVQGHMRVTIREICADVPCHFFPGSD